MSFFKKILSYFKGKNEEEEEEKTENEKQLEKKLENHFNLLKLSDENFLSKEEPFTYKTFIQGIKTQKFKKIVFLTGAGISVSAGIPDFRTPGTGLYSKLKDYNLPFPEAVFELSYFKSNPKPFYTLSKDFLTAAVKPATSHFFQKMISDLDILHYIFTQNIDSLELDAGLPSNKLCQAHGHFRTCHCIKCHNEYDSKKMMEHIIKDTIYECDEENCNGLIKPDIVFFGESLPIDFFQKSQKLKEADLVIVMGTSLVVFPFASLVNMISKKTPVVLINREDSYSSKGNKTDNYLFLGGDLDKKVKKIIKDLKMNDEYKKLKKKVLEKNNF